MPGIWHAAPLAAALALSLPEKPYEREPAEGDCFVVEMGPIDFED